MATRMTFKYDEKTMAEARTIVLLIAGAQRDLGKCLAKSTHEGTDEAQRKRNIAFYEEQAQRYIDKHLPWYTPAEPKESKAKKEGAKATTKA